jgi:hypothetical protein
VPRNFGSLITGTIIHNNYFCVPCALVNVGQHPIQRGAEAFTFVIGGDDDADTGGGQKSPFEVGCSGLRSQWVGNPAASRRIALESQLAIQVVRKEGRPLCATKYGCAKAKYGENYGLQEIP